MKRVSYFLYFVVFNLVLLPACATPLSYSAKEIRGQVVDAETSQPIEGAIVVAQWVLFHIGPGHGGHGSRLHIYETVTDSNGNYVIPAWGPKIQPPMTELHERDPEIMIFKSAYEPQVLYNDTIREEAVRISEWDGKVVNLSRTKRALEDQAFRLSSFYGEFERGGSDKDWYNYPRMLLALHAEHRRLRSLGLRPGYTGSIPNIENFNETDRVYLKKFEK